MRRSPITARIDIGAQTESHASAPNQTYIRWLGPSLAQRLIKTNTRSDGDVEALDRPAHG